MKLSRIILILVFVVNFSYSQKVELNFNGLSLFEFIKLVAKITDKNILITQNLSGKVNFISMKPVSKDELYMILLDILRSRGYTLVEKKGGYLEVVNLNDAKKLGLFQKSKFPQIQSIIIKPKYTSTNYIVNKIKSNNLLSKAGNIIDASDYIIITDFPDYLKRVMKFIKLIDKPNKKLVEFIKIKYLTSDEILKKINVLIKNLGLKNVFLTSDNYTNSIIIVTDNNNALNKIKKLISNFDVYKNPVKKETKIVYLKNSDVNEIIKTLNVLIKKYKKDKPILISDKTTNSIIIVGKPTQIMVLTSIINALDKPKEQVYVKVKILEISNLKAREIGAKLGILGGSATTSGIYTFSADLGGPALAFNPGDLGLSIPTLKEGLALGATFKLLETLGAAKKLSEPSLLCINNTPATIYVGKTISVITQSTIASKTTDLTKNTYSRQDIGLKLSITPRIDIDNKVFLHVKGIIEDILPGSQVGLPITSKREIDTSTIVKNGQSIIIGGLTRDNKDVTIDKVPFLGDIPLLGVLFRNKQIKTDKTNIVMILTPYIVKRSDDLEKLKSLLVKLNTLQDKFVKKVIKRVKEK